MDVDNILDDLDDNYYKKKSYYSWEKAIYRWRYEFKKSGLNMTLCPLSQSAKTATRLTNTAGPITSYANMKARLATWIKDKIINKIKVTRLSICNVALEMEPTLCGGIAADHEEQVSFLR